MIIFCPLSTFPPASFLAVICTADASDPASGSVKAYAPQRGLSFVKIDRKRSCCSGVPLLWIGGPPRPAPGRDNAMAGSPHAISSVAHTLSRCPSRSFFDPLLVFSLSHH